ncbi:hypothetical protein [Massilia sp. erpn]|uniref:hypothetical protein n=1 Tax=Massilia sp. erpn TaxID=2738142 RepID=UPI00210297FE|nr:hypothetical protein [Massilia sp. erpn]
MEMKNQNKETKLFAFKLAEKKSLPAQSQWKAREAVAQAGCTGPDARAGRSGGRDNGIYC